MDALWELNLIWPGVMDVIIANSVWSCVIKVRPANNNYLPSIYYLPSILYVFLLKLNVEIVFMTNLLDKTD